ncbi:MAG: hypothetical protein H0V93_16125 [Euzebyales bacterium]|jgi:FtsZ-interacting cell division protein ZipA|nr:hypothetical protein [Euzebyales bacterium]
MDTLIVIVIVIVLIAAVIAAVMVTRTRRKSEDLKDSFGPEYERTVAASGDDRKTAEHELADRQKRHDAYEIRPLDANARDRYAGAWQQAQARFVDQPSEAVSEAHELVDRVLRERGYPVDDFAEQADAVSVDHPEVVHDYRAAHAVSLANERQEATTEDLREAMVHYRSLFDRLLDGPSTQPPETQEARK